ncbi:hypothetical protein DOY81_005945 [Sarcophaga bullata]|nr:hypothetical protein DOY81_005945 [Sarcophaga bullata]
MNLKVEPCNNFYEYACGNWNEAYAGEKTNFVEMLTMLDYNANVEMYRILDELIMDGNKPKFLQNVQKYYKSCINVQTFYTKPYMRWLELYDNFRWPSRNCKYQFDWVITLAKMRTYDFNEAFIQLMFVKNKIIVIDLNKPDNFVPLTRESYYVILETLIVKNDPDRIEQFWQKMEKFEESLAALNARQFESKAVIKFKDLPLEWLKKYLLIVLDQNIINPDMELYIQNISYILALDKLLQKYNAFFLTLYLQTRFLRYLHSNAPDDFSEVDCISSARRFMPTAMHWLYEYHHPELNNEHATIYEIFNKVRQQFSKTILKNKHGFNDQLVMHLYNKLVNMKIKINNIPRVNTLATLEWFYQDLDLHEEDFYGKMSANNTDLAMAGSNNKAPFLHFPAALKPRGFHLPRNRGGQPTRQQDVTQTSAQSFYNQFFPNLHNLEQHSRSYFPLSEEPLISKFLSHHAKEFQPKHAGISAYDASVLGSGDFGILKGGTFYSGEEPSYIHEEGSDIYYGDASNAHGIASTEGFIQKYTYPEEQFAQFRDFADLSTPADSAFSQYVVVYANKNSSSTATTANSKPKNIFEQLQEIDREKALEEKKVKKNHTLSSSITKLKLVKTKLMEKKWVQRQPVKAVDDDPLIALS